MRQFQSLPLSIPTYPEHVNILIQVCDTLTPGQAGRDVPQPPDCFLEECAPLDVERESTPLQDGELACYLLFI